MCGAFTETKRFQQCQRFSPYFRFIASLNEPGNANIFFGRDHVIIFELIICGYSNPKIGEIMEKPTATIGTIKHRIKKFIIEKIAV